jgi:hypothetical protein
MISYYAFIDENNLVVDVITGRKYDEEFDDSEKEIDLCDLICN